jgi:hypothetical protein
MKKQIAVTCGLLLTLGTAVAGSLMYGSAPTEPSTEVQSYVEPSSATLSAIAPETLEFWKATAASNDYVAPKVPI